ncbi:MAG: lamin tail domain-containing protein [Myxococcota bacterium]
MKTTQSLVLATALLTACSTIVGADFDDRHERAPNGGSSSASGGSAGAPLGGASQGGATGGAPPANGGFTSNGGSSAGSSGGGASNGGAPLSSGGTSAGGGLGGSDAGGSAGELQGGTSAGAGGDLSQGGVAAGAGGTNEGGAGGDGPVGTPEVVLNEVKGQGSGDDYIELYNRGTGTANLEGYGVSDENNTFIFPAGTTLAPNQFMLLLLGQTAVGGTYTCFTPNPCFHATWGISQNGENVYFRGRQNQVLDSTMYPAQTGSNGLTNEQTWGRYPNGTGSFVANRRTPEAPNSLPP